MANRVHLPYRESCRAAQSRRRNDLSVHRTDRERGGFRRCRLTSPSSTSSTTTKAVCQAPFRTLSRKYKIEGLSEALAEGLSNGHPHMPEFVFAPEEVGAIIDYLQSIQQQ